MKYVNTGVVFQEVPDEVTLSINISNCPCHCIGCHSEYLWEDIGQPLNAMSLDVMLREYGHDITCLAFMGGDATPAEVDELAKWVRVHYPELKVAWYSGRPMLSHSIHLENFDYVKLGLKPITPRRPSSITSRSLSGTNSSRRMSVLPSWRRAQ